MIFYIRLFLLEGFSRTRPLESVQDLNVRLGIQTKLHRVIFFDRELANSVQGITMSLVSYSSPSFRKPFTQFEAY